MGTTTSKKSETAKTTTSDRYRNSSALKRLTGVYEAVATAANDPFNADGVIENPSIEIARPLSGEELVDATVYAHKANGKWIACILWSLTTEQCQGIAELPGRKHPGHATPVVAFDAAFKDFFTQLEKAVGVELLNAAWVAEIANLRTWAAQLHHDQCKTGEDLPLAGLTTIELFAGTATASLALQSLGATPLLVVEKDKHALATCRRNLKPLHVQRDILEFDPKNWKCDILFLGAVCTAHSKAGNGEGLEDEEVGPVHEAAMGAVDKIDFKVAILECASELLEPKFKADRNRWLKAFMKRGCKVCFRIMDAADFNLPQSRRRCFMVATRGDTNVDELMGFIFPMALPHTTTVEDILERHASEDQYLSRIEAKEVVWNPKPRRTRSGLRKLGFVEGKIFQGYRVYDPKSPVGATLTATGGGRARCTEAYLIGDKVRGLTPREACRMQGLPEWFAHHEKPTQALKQAGNALAYPLFYAIGERLASVLNRRH